MNTDKLTGNNRPNDNKANQETAPDNSTSIEMGRTIMGGVANAAMSTHGTHTERETSPDSIDDLLETLLSDRAMLRARLKKLEAKLKAVKDMLYSDTLQLDRLFHEIGAGINSINQKGYNLMFNPKTDDRIVPEDIARIRKEDQEKQEAMYAKYDQLHNKKDEKMTERERLEGEIKETTDRLNDCNDQIARISQIQRISRKTINIARDRNQNSKVDTVEEDS